jgi:hypothetical protein
MSQHRGYDIKKLGSKYVSMKILKDRHYGLANMYVPLFFNGATTFYKELPKASEIDYSRY